MAAAEPAAAAPAAAAPAAAAPAAAAPAPELFPFLFFGCWNQPGSGTEKNLPRDLVYKTVASMEDIKAIVIGGDNVYPRPGETVNASGKKVKNKKHEVSVFMEGIDKYFSLGIPIIPAFGNHNVLDEEVFEKQKKVFGVEATYFQHEFAGGIHIVVLDTNIILAGSEKPTYKDMLDWFRSTVSALPHDHLYFVVQHDPYFTARNKKGLGELVNADPFLDVLFSRLPIAVLCADTHHYQHSTIQRTDDTRQILHQFIVGTGGANYDKHLSGFTSEVMRGKYIYKQVKVVEGFGFLRIGGPDPAAFEFILVENWSGGARNKTRVKRYFSRQRRTRRRPH